MELNNELIDQLVKGYKKPEDIFGDSGLLKNLNKAIIERCLNSELTWHLGYEKHSPDGKNSGNTRNGTTPKTLQTELGAIGIEVPRDRKGEFEPILVKKGQRRITGMDEKIISLYARGMTTRDVQAHLQELYGVEVSPELISSITDSVLSEVQAWQNRALDPVYAVVFFDAIWIKVRQESHVINKAAYIALAIDLNGFKDVLGIWIENQEGAKFWMKVLTELQGRGLSDILIACIDGLKGLPDAIEAVFPRTRVQLCLVHMVRNSLRYTSWKDRRFLAVDLKAIYRAPTEEQAILALEALETKWGNRYPMVIASWKNNWERIRPLFDHPAEIRTITYTTNAIESLNYAIRKVTRSRGAFPTDEAAIKLIFLAIKNTVAKWIGSLNNWDQIRCQLTILFGDRVPKQ
jgi:putative transposase